MLKADEREKMKKDADLSSGTEKIKEGDISQKLSLLTQDKNAKIIEKWEFLDLNDALLQDQSHVQLGELDQEIASIKKASWIKTSNVQQLLQSNDGLATEVQNF